MGFISGADKTNIDLLYGGMPRLPDIGEEIYSKDFSVKLGGGVCATLINLARLGLDTKLITELGDDMFSLFAKREYEKLGVNLCNIYDDDGIPVNITSAVILENDRSFISYGSGGIADTEEKRNKIYEYEKGADIVLMHTDPLINEYKKLKSEGAVLILDTGWDDSLSVEKYREYLKTADYYTPNRKEALKITGADSIEEAATILNRFFPDVIIKLDSEGCLHYDGKEFTLIKSIREFRHVDSTGAGDAFLAGFTYGICKGYTVKDSILLGNITGGKAVTETGALSAYVNEEELLNIYNKNRLR